ncbi:MAG: type II RES/Xre toxin-antitoxin system antitoxin [Candidatus Anammoxibacter sp.]
MRYVRNGISYDLFEQIKNEIETSLKEISENLKINAKTLDRRKKEAKLNPVETEKILRLEKVFNKALDVFEDKNDSIKWLKEKNVHLGDVSPISLCDTEPGGNEAFNLLGRIEHGVLA